MRSTVWKNILAFAVSTCLCLIVSEVALRMLTPFPMGTMSHRPPDPILGYRLDPNLIDVDENGFRNARGKRGDYTIAAIGDSMTYGNNVASEFSWPADLERLSGKLTYNYGVGSYGIYSYHALVREELKRNNEKILVAINVGNDFAKAFSYCDIVKANSDFWQGEKRRLKLKGFESSDLETPQCRSWERPVRLKVFLTENVALISAFRFLVWDRLVPRSDDDYFVFPEGIPRVDRTYVRRGKAATDLQDPDTAALVNDLNIFLRDWAADGKGSIGLLVIPTKEAVLYETLKRHGLLAGSDPTFTAIADMQTKLAETINQSALDAGIPSVNTTNFMVDALEASIRAKKPFFPNDDSHPYIEGYEAIARAAIDVSNTLKVSASK